MNLFGLGKKEQIVWCLVDCVRVQRHDFVQFPAALGSGGYCVLHSGPKGSFALAKSHPEAPVLLNGVPMAEVQPLEYGTEYSVKIGSELFLLRGDGDPVNWVRGLDCETWAVYEAATGRKIGNTAFMGIPELANRHRLNGYDAVATVEGATQAFYLKDVLQELMRMPVPPESEPEDEAVETGGFDSEAFDDHSHAINTVSGEFTCPYCWQHFDRGNVMWIAKHADLRDPDLGEDYQLRFFPTAFDELGRAIDGMRMSCSDMACPNCKSKLPPQFLDLETHIISIVGAPSAGKSYFLTSMINQLEETLPSYFGLAFQDGDASGNALISNMRAKLFSDSRNPADIALDKTAPGAEMFREITREGRRVRLPKPFTYLVSPYGSGGREASSSLLVFYDNAGEQFEPAERGDRAPTDDVESTRHLASSSAIFFLYDPTTNVRFRKMLADKDDPQIRNERYTALNRQDNIIAEMRNRITSELNVDARDRIDTPLAMIIGKFDLWAGLMDPPLLDPVTRDGLDLDAIESNSARIREFLLGTSPGVVANAESISSEVVYFPVSPIGHSPREFVQEVDGNQLRRIGPVPGKVNPLFPEVPVLWNLARLKPDLIRTCRGGQPRT